MKISLMIKQYLAVGMVGALIGAAGFSQLGHKSSLLGAADGSWLRELESVGENAPNAFGAAANKKPARKVASAPNNSIPFTAPDVNLASDAPAAQEFAVNTEEVDRIKVQIGDLVKNTILDKPNPAQCRQHLIENASTIAAIGEVRKAVISPVQLRGVVSSACYVTILPKGCDEMVTFKSTLGFTDNVTNYCNAILASAASGADVIAIASKLGGLPMMNNTPHLLQFEVYSKGQFAHEMDQARQLN